LKPQPLQVSDSVAKRHFPFRLSSFFVSYHQSTKSTS
jgi:hypothetical protein